MEAIAHQHKIFRPGLSKKMMQLSVVLLLCSLAFCAELPKTISINELISACGFGRMDDTKRLLTVTNYFSQSEAKSVNDDIADGLTCLHLAALAGNVQVIEYLREIGADPKVTDGKNKFTPIRYALIRNCTNTAKALGELYGMGNDSELPESFKEHTETFDLKNVVNVIQTPGKPDQEGLAVVRGYLQKSGIQVINDPIPLALDKTLLHLAATNNKPEIIKLLYSLGADPNVRDRWERTPLHNATHGNDRDTLLAILSAEKIQIEAVDKQNQTPLALARNYKLAVAIEILCLHGATK